MNFTSLKRIQYFIDKQIIKANLNGSFSFADFRWAQKRSAAPEDKRPCCVD